MKTTLLKFLRSEIIRRLHAAHYATPFINGVLTALRLKPIDKTNFKP